VCVCMCLVMHPPSPNFRTVVLHINYKQSHATFVL
jgi:hypothetical protein